MLQDGSREPQTDRTNTAWRPGCTAQVPDASGARGAWVPGACAWRFSSCAPALATSGSRFVKRTRIFFLDPRRGVQERNVGLLIAVCVQANLTSRKKWRTAKAT